MASAKKISELTTAGPLTGAELVPVVQNGGTLQTTVSALAVFANTSVSANLAALEVRVSSVSAAITSINSVVANVSALTSTNAAAITSTNNVVSALSIRVDNASATGTTNSAAITSINNVVSALDVRVTSVSAAVSVLDAQMIEVLASISALNSAVAAFDVSAINALEVRVSTVSAAVSALQIQLDGVSAALTSTNNIVSALEVRVSTVSAATSVNTAAITSVNAVVSLKVFRNNDFLTNVQYIDFNTTTSYAVCAGRLTWDITHGTLDLGLTGTVNLLIGQRTVAQIYNNSGTTLPKGKAVKVTGAQGQRLTGALAQADSDSDSATIFGIMLETVSNLGSGYVATDGVVNNVDTAAYTDGDIVYLSPVSAGELTPVKPIAPQHLVQMGYIVKGGSVGGGSLYVKVQNGYELGELHNVKTSAEASIANGEVLAWNASASVWTNSTALLDTQASVSALQIQLNAVSAAVSVNAAAITSINNVVSAVEIRVDAVSASVSALQIQLNSVSAATSVNSAAITSINNVVSALDLRVTNVSASISTLQVQVDNVSAALTSTNNVVSALEVRVSSVSALASINTAAITSINNVVSALEIRVSAASATGASNTAAITSINNVVSALEIRVSTVSAQAASTQTQVNAVSVLVSALDVRVAAVSASVSALQVQVNTVSAVVSQALVSIDQRVLKAGDTMTGQLVVAVSADKIGVSVTGGLVVTSAVNFTGDSAVLLHSGTTATRPVSATPGLIRFNSGSNTFEGYTSATWGAIGGGGGATGGGTNQAFYLNDTVVSVSYTIPSGKNAGTFGPITVASGVTVEVPSGSVWTVV